MYKCPDACTHYNQVVGQDERLLGHAHSTTQRNTFVHRGRSIHEESVDMLTCTDACTHLTKVSDNKRDVWYMHAGPDRGAHIYTQLCKADGADKGNQMHMHACTDACTHSNQGVGPH